jgi:hypothetical protein
MRVKCINERLSPELHNEKLVEWAKHSDLEISLNKTYVVLAISRYFDTIFFYILGDESNNYPLAFPSVLFEIIDIKYSI